MGDVRLKQTRDGLKIWRTTKAAGGSAMIVPGSIVIVEGRQAIVKDLPPFRKVKLEPPKIGD